jgi:hypothetical protein
MEYPFRRDNDENVDYQLMKGKGVRLLCSISWPDSHWYEF